MIIEPQQVGCENHGGVDRKRRRLPKTVRIGRRNPKEIVSAEAEVVSIAIHKYHCSSTTIPATADNSMNSELVTSEEREKFCPVPTRRDWPP